MKLPIQSEITKLQTMNVKGLREKRYVPSKKRLKFNPKVFQKRDFWDRKRKK